MTNIKVKFNDKTGGYTCYMMVDGEITKREEWRTRRDALASDKQYAELIGIDHTPFGDPHEDEPTDNDLYRQMMAELAHFRLS